MSVRAYIVREQLVWLDIESNLIYKKRTNDKNLKEFVHKDLEYVFNIWHQDKLLDILFKNGACDFTNNDYICTIEIEKEYFDELIKNINNNRYSLTNDDLDSINLMKKYFDEGNDYLVLECF